jgi:AcrR family transcriptional regulator
MRQLKDHRNRIVELAKRRFLAHGFQRVSLDSLVGELHTSKSTIYQYFKTKEELVKAVIDQLDLEINTRLEDIICDDQPFGQKLSRIIDFTKALLAEINEIFLYDLQNYAPEMWSHYEMKRESRINRHYRELFESGIEDGLIRDDIDIDILLSIYLQLTEIPVSPEQFTRLHVSNQQLYDEVSRVFLEGILLREELNGGQLKVL